MGDPHEMALQIVKGLTEISGNKGIMSKLRKGLIEETQFHSWPIIARWCDLNNDRMRLITLTVAGFFAIHPLQGQGNIGHSLRVLAMRRDPRAGLNLMERHLNNLLRCSGYGDLCERLGFIIRMMRAEKVSVDYGELYKDLCYWGDRVRIRWTSEYYKEDLNVLDTNNS